MLILDEQEAIRQRRENIRVVSSDEAIAEELVDPRDEKIRHLNEALELVIAELTDDVPERAA